MGNSLASQEIIHFLNRLSKRYTQPIELYLLGGSALCLLGNPRRTLDIDCTVSKPTQNFKNAVETVSNELKVEVEIIQFDEFIPLLPDTEFRHHLVGQYGNIRALVYDPYSIALSKLARGFDTDIQDILFLLHQKIIEIDLLKQFTMNSVPQAWDYDINPQDLISHLDVVIDQHHKSN